MSTSKNRRLAAILFADIVGYTALMQKDEGQTMSRLKQYQQVLQKEVAIFNGEIIKNYGDGSLCIFSSVLDAVLCAQSVQEQLQKAPKVPLRIGLHLGDVIYEGNDIYGNALNIASRIESLGVAGSVLFSKNIQEKVKNQQALQMQSLGSFEFKNVEEPIEVFALANEGLVIPKRNEIKGKTKEKKKSKNKWLFPIAAMALSLFGFFLYQKGFAETKIPDEVLNSRIAVIPFENKTNDTLLNVLGNLTADCITRNLTNLDNTKISQYENVQQNLELLKNSPQQFVDATGADYLIQGRFYKEGNELIFESQITNPISNEVIFFLNEIRGKEDKPSAIISELAQRITGYFSF